MVSATDILSIIHIVRPLILQHSQKAVISD